MLLINSSAEKAAPDRKNELTTTTMPSHALFPRTAMELAGSFADKAPALGVEVSTAPFGSDVPLGEPSWYQVRRGLATAPAVTRRVVKSNNQIWRHGH